MKPVLLLGCVGLAVLAAACKREDRASVGDTASTSLADSAAVLRDTNMTSANAGAAAGMSDANIMYTLDQANASDSARGALAATKGTSAAVRNFGKQMAGDHHAMRTQGEALAKRLNITPEAPPNKTMQTQDAALLDSLNKMPKGAAWDNFYMTNEIGAHRMVLDIAQRASTATQNADIKNLIAGAKPIVQHHLDEAQDIQSKMTP